jgi:hypothetical protein
MRRNIPVNKTQLLKRNHHHRGILGFLLIVAAIGVIGYIIRTGTFGGKAATLPYGIIPSTTSSFAAFFLVVAFLTIIIFINYKVENK